ncbi:MAG: hypothetical protein KAI81_10185, partial [Candidatus Marinimicrobia bacterium]|nr:hypothetical protein [Candidatus Neomarinimicrobiota bacterium]
MKISKFKTLTIFILFSVILFAQHPGGHGNGDLTHSVFGPPRPNIWEYQLSTWKADGEMASSFNFYKKNQRNKTIYMKIMDNGLDVTLQNRVSQLQAGGVLFPFHNDDRYRMDVGIVYDKLKDVDASNKSIVSRMTVAPMPFVWFRGSVEYVNTYVETPGVHGAPAVGEYVDQNSAYVAGKFKAKNYTLMGYGGTKDEGLASTTYMGASAILKGYKNYFIMGGFLNSSDQTVTENESILALGRWASFRPDGLPATVLVWKHRENYDFVLSGFFWGKRNLFVRPAALGMSQGMALSSMSFRENSDVRRAQLMTINDESR